MNTNKNNKDFEYNVLEHYINLIDILNFALTTMNTFVMIKNEDGNIIYPKDISVLNKINHILEKSEYYSDDFNGSKKMTELYDSEYNHFYKVITEVYTLINRKNYEVKIIQNISKEKHFELNSKIDAITGIYNNRAIMEKLQNCIINPNNFLDSFAVIICDIDNFKNINDTYTHTGGDLVLKEIATILNNATKNNGFCGRYGGDEFICILKNIDSINLKEKIEKIIDKIRKINLNYRNNQIKNITMSFGATIILNNCIRIKEPADIENWSKKIFEIADQSLYDSKRKGKDQFIICELQ